MMPPAKPFFKHQYPPRPSPPVYPQTTQAVAIVVCGGGDPFAEFEQAKAMCIRNAKNYTVIAGNDMIADLPGQIDHAVTLHPDKLQLWFGGRRANASVHKSPNKFAPPGKVWAHRPFSAVTNWTRDWGGSTGLLCVKIARELGFVHIVLCGVPMTISGKHYKRQTDWIHCTGFLRGWTPRILELKRYVRSYGGWTAEQFGQPTDEWMLADLKDEHIATLGVGARA